MESLVASAYDLTPAHPGADVHGGLGGLSPPIFLRSMDTSKSRFIFGSKNEEEKKRKKMSSLFIY